LIQLQSIQRVAAKATTQEHLMQMTQHLMARLSRLILASLLPFLACSTAQAGVQYRVNIDTQSLAGSAGYLDFGLVGLADSPSATVSIHSLNGGAALGAPLLDGEAAVQPGGWTLGNGGAFNAILQGWRFGSALFFELDFSGDWLTAMSGSGTSFALKLWDEQFNNVLTLDPAGDLLRIELNAGGQVDVVPLSADGQGIQVQSISHHIPEPGALSLLVLALGLLSLNRRWPH
jgi:hypothetical protein